MLEDYKDYWRNGLDFRGTTTRREFWLGFWVPTTIIYIVLLLGVSLTKGSLVLALIFILFGVANLVPALAIEVRRIRDGGFSPWLILLGLIPFIGGIIIFILLLFPTSPMNKRIY